MTPQAQKRECCPEVCACAANIKNLQRENDAQWGEMKELGNKQDTVLTRINFILGGIAVSCILLVINLVVKLKGG